jgi:hypothetical protein
MPIKNFISLLLLITIFTMHPYMTGIITSKALDPYGYSIQILTYVIDDAGFINQEKLSGDHWRWHAGNFLGEIRPLTSVLVSILGQVTSLDRISIANFPIFSLLIIVVVYLLVLNSLLSHSLRYYPLYLFFALSFSLIQTNGVHYISYGFSLLILLIYLSVVHWIKNESPGTLILLAILLITISRTYYTTFMASVTFLIVITFYRMLFLGHRYKNLSLIFIVYLFIHLSWVDNLVLEAMRNISYENIYLAAGRVLTLRLATPTGPLSSYVEPLPTTSSAMHSIMRIAVSILGAYAIFMCFKEKTLHQYTDLILGFLLIGLSESIAYTLVGGVLLVRVIYSISLPYIIILWIGNVIKEGERQHKKIITMLLLILCVLSVIMVLRNYETLTNESVFAKNIEILDLILPNDELADDTSYIFITPVRESSLVSYRTLKSEHNVITTFTPLSLIIRNDLDEFFTEINILPQDEKIVLLPKKYPYIELKGVWSNIYQLKSELYRKLAEKTNIKYDGPYVIYGPSTGQILSIKTIRLD